MIMRMDKSRYHIGVVSTRLAGTDGVTLETRKWVNVLTRMGHRCFFFAGESDWPAEESMVVSEAHFNHPEILAITADLFDDERRSSEISGKIHTLRYTLKQRLYEFVDRFGVELLLVENALSIPMNIPLGLALTELIAETKLPTIAHHHDFSWERSRFKVSAASDFQLGVFPPILPSVQHVVINTYASRQLALRTGLSSHIIPNVMDFDHPPQPPDEYAQGLREALGITPDEYLLLQPTRIVPRKRIEMAIELVHRLELPCALVITHSSGDEGEDYEAYLRDFAQWMGVRVLFAADRFAYERGCTPRGQKVYSLADAYQHADLVTYPSTVEGFGNAFLESVYYRRPILMCVYEIFRIDIQPKGFEVIGFGDFIDQATLREAERILRDKEAAQEMVAHNYALGRRYYSYRMLEDRLQVLLGSCMGAQ